MCKEVKTRKYQTRKSPPFHAKDCKMQQKKGKNGMYISKQNARGTYKWIKITAKTQGKYYDTHDNGSRPFRVMINGSHVTIYKNPDKNPNEKIKEFNVKKVFIGKSKNKFAGNTILLHVSGKKYVYIGAEIYEFEMEDDVETYFSLIGNSDVPYPIVLGKKNVYFMLKADHSYVPRDKFPANTEWDNAYTNYYGFVGEALKKYAVKMKGFRSFF